MVPQGFRPLVQHHGPARMEEEMISTWWGFWPVPSWMFSPWDQVVAWWLWGLEAGWQQTPAGFVPYMLCLFPDLQSATQF